MSTQHNPLDDRVYATNTYETMYWLAMRKQENMERINTELLAALTNTLEAHDCAGCEACQQAHKAIQNAAGE